MIADHAALAIRLRARWCCVRRTAALAARAEADVHLTFRDARLSSLDACQNAQKGPSRHAAAGERGALWEAERPATHRTHAPEVARGSAAYCAWSTKSRVKLCPKWDKMQSIAHGGKTSP